MKEYRYDKLLNINTAGEPVFYDNFNYHRYEPTPYSALEELFKSYEVNRNDGVVDFGCGKGRLNFYIHYHFKASVIGVEMNEDLHQKAVENYKSYIKKHRISDGQIQFYCTLAEKYRINPSDNRFYFFNPFSVHIFRTTIANILHSFEECPRDLALVLYYPSEDYVYFLENETPFAFRQEIILQDLYDINPSERFLIYGLDV